MPTPFSPLASRLRAESAIYAISMMASARRQLFADSISAFHYAAFAAFADAA